MTIDYKEYLNQEIEKACRNFEEAKRKAIRDLEAMTIRDATNYGAAYFTHIDNVTKYAAEAERLNDLLRAYNYIMKENEDED